MTTSTAAAARPTFNASADATLARVAATYGQRGFDYGDTLALPNIKTTFTEYVLNLPRELNYRAWLRLLQLAAIIDIKETRIGTGSSVDDSLIDGLAYRAVFIDLLADYRAVDAAQLEPSRLVDFAAPSTSPSIQENKQAMSEAINPLAPAEDATQEETAPPATEQAPSPESESTEQSQPDQEA